MELNFGFLGFRGQGGRGLHILKQPGTVAAEVTGKVWLLGRGGWASGVALPHPARGGPSSAVRPGPLCTAPQKPEHRWADPPLWGRGSCEHLFSAISFQKEVSGKPSSSPTFCKPCDFENVSPWLFYSAQK